MTGFVIGFLCSAVLPVFSVNPSRLMPGTAISLLQAAPLLSVLLIGILLSVILTGFSSKRGLQLISVFLALLWFLSFVLITLNLIRASSDEGLFLQRISFKSGFWLSFLVLYIFLFYMRVLFNVYKWLTPFMFLLFTVFIIYVVNNELLVDTALYKEFDTNRERFIREFFNHLKIAFSSVGYGILIGLPLAIAATRNKTVEKIILPFVKIVQTIPSLSLFGFLIPPLTFLSGIAFFKTLGVRGTGITPAIIALTLYSLLPIVQNTYTALKQVEKGIIDAARGMGMTPVQRFFKAELLLAFPVIITGIRTAMVQITGNTTMAALIGAGGLGVFIFNGLGQGAMALIVLGAIPIIVLAIVIDSGMNFIYKLLKRMLLIPEVE